MAEQAELAKTASPQPELAGDMRYVARQPILDAQGRVHAYDLLFRNAPEVILRRDADLAVQTMLDNEVVFGLERLTNGLPAFIACTAEALIEGSVLAVKPSLTVLGIPSAMEFDARLLQACRDLRARGFRISLDDFPCADEVRHPLLDQADYIRCDLRRFGEAERQLIPRIGDATPSMVAQRVFTREDRGKAGALGFRFFQGDYFCHPVLLKKRKVPANGRAHFDIVRQLYHDPIDIRRVSELVRRDASLTYRLLRLVNSPIYGIYREVRSVETAITVLGEATFRRVVSLAVLSELNGDQPPPQSTWRWGAPASASWRRGASGLTPRNSICSAC
jgi:EAL and modified HD-GYP domain-containing signal transduction protein